MASMMILISDHFSNVSINLIQLFRVRYWSEEESNEAAAWWYMISHPKREEKKHTIDRTWIEQISSIEHNDLIRITFFFKEKEMKIKFIG